ncbi:hypothetical protein [Sinorhizobium sp. M4_45]|uniref:hypothetical protein n=1 Tax=Sinorhizobium sp. M4_45 TaxID=2037901 RepID=UPI000C9CFB8A|nr:hypothetical protein [Sinorhizobium sp. M4_45]PND24894.1 hypothetical protein CN933_24540 [Sinorhizobium sp. M4_45]
MQPTPVIVSIMLTVNAHAALACGYHSSLDSSTFNVAHPGSVAVASAIYHAGERGILDDRITTARSATLFGQGYREAVEQLRRLERGVANRTADLGDTGSRRFAVLFVRSRLWSDFTAQPGRTKVNIHVDGPVQGEPIVLTDESVLRALFSEQLTFDVAVNQGLLQILQDRDGRTHALLQAAIDSGSL